MSVYNGFATRKLETKYLKCMYYMFVILQAKVASSYDGTPFDEVRFQEKFTKIYTKMTEMDKYKYLHPRFSMCFDEILQVFDIPSIKHNYKEKKRNQSHNRKHYPMVSAHARTTASTNSFL